MKRVILNIVFCFVALFLSAQDQIDVILNSVEKNNTTLNAYRSTIEARKLDNRSGIYLPDPEAELGFLRSNSGPGVNRVDINISQSFDIPTISGMKSRLADQQNISLEWRYKMKRIDILLEAKLFCLEAIYLNNLKEVLEVRLAYANSVSEAWQNRLDTGDANMIEFNKTRLNLINARGELMEVNSNLAVTLKELKRLNGGEDIQISGTSYSIQQLPESIDEWIDEAQNRSPDLLYLKQEVEVSRALISLNRARNMPVFSTGYLSEKVGDEHFQGVGVGLSIPLWENKNRVSQSKAEALAAEERQIDGSRQFNDRSRNNYRHAVELREIADSYKEVLESINSAELLKKAVDSGEISILDYFTELAVYYQAVDLALKAEYEYQREVARLLAVEL